MLETAGLRALPRIAAPCRPATPGPLRSSGRTSTATTRDIAEGWVASQSAVATHATTMPATVEQSVGLPRSIVRSGAATTASISRDIKSTSRSSPTTATVELREIPPGTSEQVDAHELA